MLPWTKVKLSVGYSHHNLTPHNLPLEMSVSIVFPRAIVLVSRRCRRENQPNRTSIVLGCLAAFALLLVKHS